MLSEVRQPKLTVQLDGVTLPGVLGADIHSNNHFAADRFQVQFASTMVPDAVLHIPGQRLSIAITVDGITRTLIVGAIDAVHRDPVMRTVSVEGRDLSALLIETQTSETFPNRTASEIAVIMAGRHDLAAIVQQTNSPVGRYYQSDRERITLGQFAKTTTEWDLLAFLASREGFDLYMEEDALRFTAPVTDATAILAAEQCIAMSLEHCVSLARPMQFDVKSWNSKTGATTSETVQSSGVGAALHRVLTRPNLSPEEAQSLAQRSLADLKRHEWLANVTIPGELTLSARSLVSIVGTGTQWDRSYSVSKLTRHLDAQRGYTQRMSLQGVQ